MNQDFPIEMLRPVVTGWLGKIEASKRSAARKRWDEQVRECKMFYSGKTGFMWDPASGSQFWQGIPAPRFRITLNKAFELVAIFGPTMYFNAPHRRVEPKRPIEIPPEIFGNLQDPNVAMIHQQAMAMYQQEFAADKATAMLMETWLNYTPREQPGGGLATHGERAITDALITGRGCLFARPFKMPGSGKTLTGCFREPPENLLIDPDFNDINDAKWIAQKCIHPVWQVEKEYGHEPGSLKNKGSLESAWSEGERLGDSGGNMHRQAGTTNDLMVYYKIWSKTGPGTRMTGVQSEIKEQLEAVVGDYAYIVIAPDVPYPLNCPIDRLRSGATDADVKQMFSWPIPFFADDRWPVQMLDFYPENDSPWPLPPLAPGLGELKFLNFMVSHLANRIWKSSRDFIACAKSAMTELEKHLTSGDDMTVLPLADIQGDISKVLTWIQQPETNLDVWKIIDAVSEIFDKRVGLTELAYGLNPGGTQNRSAEETATKRQAFSIRPEHMQKKVEEWMSQCSASEAFCTRWFVTGEDVQPLIGQVGRHLWEQLVMSTDVEKVVRQMQYTVEAGSTRRPNKDRDVANASQALTTFFPFAAEYGMGSGNFGPANAMIAAWGKAADMDTQAMMIPPPPPPDPNVPDPAQQQLEMEREQMQMEAEGKQQEIGMKREEMDMKLAHAKDKHAVEMQSRMDSIAVSQMEAAANPQPAAAKKRQPAKVGA